MICSLPSSRSSSELAGLRAERVPRISAIAPPSWCGARDGTADGGGRARLLRPSSPRRLRCRAGGAGADPAGTATDDVRRRRSEAPPARRLRADDRRTPSARRRDTESTTTSTAELDDDDDGHRRARRPSPRRPRRRRPLDPAWAAFDQILSARLIGGGDYAVSVAVAVDGELVHKAPTATGSRRRRPRRPRPRPCRSIPRCATTVLDTTTTIPRRTAGGGRAW